MAPTMTTINISSLHQYRVKREEVKATTITTTKGALQDKEANRSKAGSDMKILLYDAQDRALVTGIARNMLLNLPIVTGAASSDTMDGPIIGIFHQYAYYSKGNRSTLCPSQKATKTKLCVPVTRNAGCKEQ